MKKMIPFVAILIALCLVAGATAVGSKDWWIGKDHSLNEFTGVRQIVVRVGGVKIPCIVAIASNGTAGVAISCNWYPAEAQYSSP